MASPDLAPTPSSATVLAARSMVVIGVLSGVATWGTSFLPYPAGFDAAAVRTVGLATVAASLLVLLVPWRRFPLKATLVLVPVALTLISVHNTVSSGDAYRYGTFFLVLFMWIGIWHPRGTSLAVSPFAAVAYVVPLLLTHQPTYAGWTVLYALPVFVVGGEVLAWRSQALASALQRVGTAAVTDSLTGLPDRTVFEQAVADAAGTGAQVLFLDVDQFKAVNDRYGHAAGDAVLVAVADALRRSVREGDLVARVAGDEFGAVLLGPVTAADGEAVRARLAAALTDAGPGGTPVLVSAGMSGTDTVSAHEAVAAADAAMYREKLARRQATA
ncbi:MAG: diguanylate cyclase domain-containing protein [Angustibacter sp.]